MSPDIFLLTTLPLDRLSSFIPSLSTWTVISPFIHILVDESELPPPCSDLPTYLRFIPYRPQHSKTPSLQQVASVFHHSNNSQYLAFFNADISYQPLYQPSLFPSPGIIPSLFSDLHVLFAHRHDYRDQAVLGHHPYLDGFDYFSLTRSSLPLLFGISPDFSIGQVGWDYYLPLSIPRNRVATVSTLPLFHKIHPTSSTSSWDSSMLSLFPLIHLSWIQSRPYPFRVFFFLVRACLSPRLPYLNKVSNLFPFRYLLSRICCYCFIKPMLASASRHP